MAEYRVRVRGIKGDFIIEGHNVVVQEGIVSIVEASGHTVYVVPNEMLAFIIDRAAEKDEEKRA